MELDSIPRKHLKSVGKNGFVGTKTMYDCLIVSLTKKP